MSVLYLPSHNKIYYNTAAFMSDLSLFDDSNCNSPGFIHIKRADIKMSHKIINTGVSLMCRHPTWWWRPYPSPITSIRPQNVMNVLSKHTSPSLKSLQIYSVCTAAFQWIYQLANICSISNRWGQVWRVSIDPGEGGTPQSRASSHCICHRVSFLWRGHKISPLSLPICLCVLLRRNYKLSGHELECWG